MARPKLRIDLAAIKSNFRSLCDLLGCGVEGAAVVKANAYGLGIRRVAPALYQAGARTYFVALAEEGAELRASLSGDAHIFVLSGHMSGDDKLLDRFNLIPVICSVPQMSRHEDSLPGHPFALQIDTGMNRLGLEADEFAKIRDRALAMGPKLVMSHLACADEPASTFNPEQLGAFHRLTDGLGCPRSLAATGGTLLGSAYHFDMCRLGIGLYGGAPYLDAKPVAGIELPVVQIREVRTGEYVGYGIGWQAERCARIATVSAGYADGIHRILGKDCRIHAGNQKCKLVGRISMDLITVDITGVEPVPETLQLVGPDQSIDQLAGAANTIGYELLTSLGQRYEREYVE